MERTEWFRTDLQGCRQPPFLILISTTSIQTLTRITFSWRGQGLILAFRYFQNGSNLLGWILRCQGVILIRVSRLYHHNFLRSAHWIGCLGKEMPVFLTNYNAFVRIHIDWALEGMYYSFENRLEILAVTPLTNHLDCLIKRTERS